MTVGDLQAQLAKLDAQADVLVAVNGVFTAAVGVVSAAGAPFIVIRGRGQDQASSRFSVGEEGVIGRLTRLGASDDEIAEVLGRSADSVRRKRNALGIA